MRVNWFLVLSGLVFIFSCGVSSWKIKKYDAYPTENLPEITELEEYVHLGSWMLVKGKQDVRVRGVEVAGVLELCEELISPPIFRVQLDDDLSNGWQGSTVLVEAQYNRITNHYSFVTSLDYLFRGSRMFLNVSLILPETNFCPLPENRDFVLSSVIVQEMEQKVSTNILVGR